MGGRHALTVLLCALAGLAFAAQSGESSGTPLWRDGKALWSVGRVADSHECVTYEKNFDGQPDVPSIMMREWGKDRILVFYPSPCRSVR